MYIFPGIPVPNDPADADRFTIYINLIILISFLVFARLFSYFRIIKAISSIVGIVVVVTQKLFIFLLVLVYFFVCIGTLLRYIDIRPDATFETSFIDMYVWTIMGGVEQENFYEFAGSSLFLILSTIYITIILLNILIAYLSNVFSRLEERQKINLIKEKASMILDLEVLVYFFKFVLSKKSKYLKDYGNYQDSEHLTLHNASFQDLKDGVSLKEIEFSFEKGSNVQLTPNLLLKHRKFLFIMKKNDLEESHKEEISNQNIYRTISDLSKNFDEFDCIFGKQNKKIKSKLDSTETKHSKYKTLVKKEFDQIKNDQKNLNKLGKKNYDHMMNKLTNTQQIIVRILNKVQNKN